MQIMPTMLQGLAEIGRIRSIRYGLSDGIVGLLSYSGSKTLQQETEVKRRLEQFVYFVDYFEAVDSYDKAKERNDPTQIRKLEAKLVENIDVYTGLASIFKPEERQSYQGRLKEARDVVTAILRGNIPPRDKIESAIATLREMKKTVIERTSDQEKTAERIIYGSAPAF